MGSTGGRDGRGMSTAIAVLLLVAIVVILAVALTGLVTTFVSLVPDVGPQAAFEFEFTDEGTTDALDIEHLSGDSIDGDLLEIRVRDAVPSENDGTYVWAGDALGGTDPAMAGHFVTLDVDAAKDEDTLNLNEATVLVVWNGSEGANDKVLARWSGPGNASRDASAVTEVAGSADPDPPTGPGDEALTFEFTASANVTIVEFELLATKDLDVDTIARMSPEVKITGGGEDGKADSKEVGGTSNGYRTDGREYPLNETAEVNDGKTASVNIGDFPEEVTAEFTSAKKANFVVTFVLGDGSEKKFYFDVTLQN